MDIMLRYINKSY